MIGACFAYEGCSRTDAIAPVAGPPAMFSIVSGNNQSALGGTSLASPIVFKLVDANGRAVPNRKRDISSRRVMALNAWTTVSDALTDGVGNATAPTWMMGKLAIPQQLSATIGSVSATANATVSTQYRTARF